MTSTFETILESPDAQPTSKMRTSILLGFFATMINWADTEPLRVTVVASPKPYLVGRAIEVTVEVESGPGSPRIETPQIPGLDLFAMPTDPARPSIARFVLVPRQAGPLDLPVFRARSGGRSGASKPNRLTVANLPAEERTSAFLGGVGPFNVRAEADRISVRPGETLELRVILSGQAAWGSVRTPDLTGWATPQLAVATIGDRLDPTETPVRTFRYRVRPLLPGPVVFPPVAVAAFDPLTRRYATRATSKVTIQVGEPTPFDLRQLDYRPLKPIRRVPMVVTVGLISGSVLVVSALALALWLVARRRRKSGACDPSKLARELSQSLEDRDDEVEAARAIAEALTTFLHRAGQRAPGALTPPEARAGFERLTNDPRLSAFAEALLNRCDRARFGLVEDEEAGMIAEGRDFFGEVARAMAGRGKGGPGEAVETASES